MSIHVYSDKAVIRNDNINSMHYYTANEIVTFDNVKVGGNPLNDWVSEISNNEDKDYVSGWIVKGLHYDIKHRTEPCCELAKQLLAKLEAGMDVQISSKKIVVSVNN